MSDFTISNTTRLYAFLLLSEEPKHGYQLIKDIETLTGTKPSTSHIYPFLSSLENRGFVIRDDTDEDGRITYHLTETGRQVVNEQLETFRSITTAAIKGEITECVHCACKIYDDGYESNGETYCCKHCAQATQA